MPTNSRLALSDELSNIEKKYSVKDERIVYDGKLAKETRTFVREYDGIVCDFLPYHKGTLKAQEVTYLSDNGSAFCNAYRSVIEQLGFGKHVFYPAWVHQYMSPNDNKLHGVAKAKYRSTFTSFDNDVECSVALMNCPDSTPEDNIREWWVNNLFLPYGIAREEQVQSAIFGAQSKWDCLQDACLDDYAEWYAREQELATVENGAARRRSSGLDGSYWTQIKNRR